MPYVCEEGERQNDRKKERKKEREKGRKERNKILHIHTCILTYVGRDHASNDRPPEPSNNWEESESKKMVENMFVSTIRASARHI